MDEVTISNGVNSATLRSDQQSARRRRGSSGEETNEFNREASERLASLIVYTVSLIVICLTVFNFYLLVWIWSSLRDGRQLDLLSSWDEFRIKAKLVSRREFEVDQINSKNKEKVEIILLDDDEGEDNQNDNNFIKFQTPYPQIEEIPSNEEGEGISRGSLVKLTNDAQCNFENGFRVRGLSSGRVALDCAFNGNFIKHHHHHQQQQQQQPMRQREKQDNRIRQEQEREREQLCLIQMQSQEQIVQLSNVKGVDFLRKSVQTNKIKTRRLHSALNELHLMSSNESFFDSSNGTIGIHSMNDLIFASKRTNVIVEAKTLNLSLVLDKQFKAESSWRSGRKVGYKLCICLEAEETRSKTITTKSSYNQEKNNDSKSSDGIRRTNNGRLFAIANDLKCEKFTKSFCQLQKHSSKTTSN